MFIVNTNSLKKAERLHSKKIIERLFSRGQSAFAYPIMMRWILLNEDADIPVRAMVSVSKKNIRKAVHRNKIKRRLREAYRLNKQPLIESLSNKQQNLAIAFIYVGKDTGHFNDMEQKIIKLIDRLIHYNEKDIR